MKYDYKCKDCEVIFETNHEILEKPTIVCPKCESKNTFKYLGNVTPIHFQQGHAWTCGQHDG